EETAWDNERERIVHEAISQLPETERKVLTLRFGTGREEPQTLTAIGKRLGFSAERASQLEQRALKKLAESPELAALREAAEPHRRGRPARERNPDPRVRKPRRENRRGGASLPSQATGGLVAL